MSIYIATLFAAVYYLLYFAIGESSFSKSNLNFFEILLFSFSVFYSSPISEILPQNIFMVIFTWIETLSAYSFLVLFGAFLLDKYSDHGRVEIEGKSRKILRNPKRFKFNRYKKG
jgi:hypothetical protein